MEVTITYDSGTFRNLSATMEGASVEEALSKFAEIYPGAVVTDKQTVWRLPGNHFINGVVPKREWKI